MPVAIPTLYCGGRCEEVTALYKRAFDLKVGFLGKDEQINLMIGRITTTCLFTRFIRVLLTP